MYGMSAPELSLVVVDMTEKAMNAMRDRLLHFNGCTAAASRQQAGLRSRSGKCVYLAKQCKSLEIFTKSSDDLSFSVFSV